MDFKEREHRGGLQEGIEDDLQEGDSKEEGLQGLVWSGLY